MVPSGHAGDPGVPGGSTGLAVRGDVYSRQFLFLSSVAAQTLPQSSGPQPLTMASHVRPTPQAHHHNCHSHEWLAAATVREFWTLRENSNSLIACVKFLDAFLVKSRKNCRSRRFVVTSSVRSCALQSEVLPPPPLIGQCETRTVSEK